MKAFWAERIFDGEKWHGQHALLVQEGRVLGIEAINELDPSVPLHSFPAGAVLAPAFIDIQVYGAMGQLLAVHPNPASLNSLQQYALQGGTAWTLPTVATNTYDVFYQCIDAVREYWQQGAPGILGLHIEGPWLHPLRKGAHKEEWIHTPNLQQAQELMDHGKSVIKMITLAPEVVANDIIHLLKENGIIISAGHSNATYEEAKTSFHHGISAVTHLFNAMSPLQHRAPGLVGAALDDAEVMVSIIPDGHHVDFAAVRIACAAAPDRLFVITDAVTDTTDGPYPHTRDGDKYVSNGILSGSALQMNVAVRNLVKEVGLDLGPALRMCSALPALALRQPDITGCLLPGHRADYVVLDENLDVIDCVRATI